MLTEQPNPATEDIDRLSTLEMIQVINQEDQRVALAVREALPQIARAIDRISEQLRDGGRLVYVGAGTSGRLGILDAVECVPTFSTPPEMVQGLIAGGAQAVMQAVEGAEDSREGGADDLQAIALSGSDVVVGIAASGRTPYVLGAVAYARSLSVPTIGIACNVPAPLLDAVDIPIGVQVGAEVITGSTRLKAGTAQKMILNMLSTGTMIRLGKVYGNRMVDVQVTNEKLAQRARRLVMELAGVDETTATDLLKTADQQVKTAIVMHRRSVSATAARELLAAQQGNLRRVLEN